MNRMEIFFIILKSQSTLTHTHTHTQEIDLNFTSDEYELFKYDNFRSNIAFLLLTNLNSLLMLIKFIWEFIHDFFFFFRLKSDGALSILSFHFSLTN